MSNQRVSLSKAQSNLMVLASQKRQERANQARELLQEGNGVYSTAAVSNLEEKDITPPQNNDVRLVQDDEGNGFLEWDAAPKSAKKGKKKRSK